VDFNAALTHASATVFVEGAFTPWTNRNALQMEFNFSLNPTRLNYVGNYTDGFGGTDSWVELDPGGSFFAISYNWLGPLYVQVNGIVTKEHLSVPDTGDAAGMLGFALLAIAATKYRRNL
jgi:hypothetical protein